VTPLVGAVLKVTVEDDTVNAVVETPFKKHLTCVLSI
jgi:hypothetical protein